MKILEVVDGWVATVELNREDARLLGLMAAVAANAAGGDASPMESVGLPEGGRTGSEMWERTFEAYKAAMELLAMTIWAKDMMPANAVDGFTLETIRRPYPPAGEGGA